MLLDDFYWLSFEERDALLQKFNLQKMYYDLWCEFWKVDDPIELTPDALFFQHTLLLNDLKYRISFIELPMTMNCAFDFTVTKDGQVIECKYSYKSHEERVGKKSCLTRLPNELFYKVIELFITKC